MIQEVIFDVETKKLFSDISRRDPGELGVSVVSAYIRMLDQSFQEVEGRMQSFWEDELVKLWLLFQEADRIIAFNSLHFDIPALQPYAPFPLMKLPHFDVFDHVRNAVGRRVSLNVLAEQTLKTPKSDSGRNAVAYWKQGTEASLAKLRKYCEQDVLLTRDLYDHGRKYGKLAYTDQQNRPHEIHVDFSYPPDFTSRSKQIGLFR